NKHITLILASYQQQVQKTDRVVGAEILLLLLRKWASGQNVPSSPRCPARSSSSMTMRHMVLRRAWSSHHFSSLMFALEQPLLPLRLSPSVLLPAHSVAYFADTSGFATVEAPRCYEQSGAW